MHNICPKSIYIPSKGTKSSAESDFRQAWKSSNSNGLCDIFFVCEILKNQKIILYMQLIHQDWLNDDLSK